MKPWFLALFFVIFGVGTAFAQGPTSDRLKVDVQDSSGHAVAGAKIMILQRGPRTSVIAASKTTDADGVADISDIPVADWREIAAFHAGLGLAYVRIPERTKECHLTMKSPAAGRVRLIDPEGNPAKSVGVAAIMFSPGQQGANDHFLFFGDGNEAPAMAPTATSDSNGIAQFEDLPSSSKVRVQVFDARYARLNYEAAIQTPDSGTAPELRVQLKSAATVDGRVLRNGSPAAGVRVGAQSQNGWGEGVTSADGSYHIGRLEAGTYNLALDLEGDMQKDWTAAARAGVSIAAGDHLSGADFDLIRGAVIQGTLRDGSGKPLPKQPIGVYGPAHPQSGAWVQGTQTDESGRFTLRVPPGKQYVYFMANLGSNSDQSHVNVTVKDGETATVNLQGVIAEAAEIDGTVVDQAGNPVEGASVVAMSAAADERSPNGGAISDSAGAFAIQMYKSDFPVELRARSGSSGTPAPVELKSAGAVKIVLQKDAMASISGVVTNPAGTPIPGARVVSYEWHNNMGESGDSVTTDSLGRYSISGLWPDWDFSLDVRAAGFGVGQPNHKAPGSNAVVIDPIRLPIADSFVEGRVVDEHGMPVAGASVMADPFVETPSTTGRDGRFRFDGIPKGDVSLRAFLGSRFIERRVAAGKSIELTLKNEPDEPTPAISKAPIAVGSNAIDLKINGWVQSKPLTLAGLTGKIVVLDFWAVWCGPCKEELPHVEALAKEFAGRPVVVIGVHDDTAVPKELVEFAKEHGLTYALAIDKTSTNGFGITANAYGVQGIPTMVIIGKDGKVASIPEGAVDAAKQVQRLLGNKPGK